MKTSTLKARAITLTAAAMLCAATMSAQTVKKHVVERGETLESIARKHGTTAEELVKLNPDAAQFVYVGMELNLPEAPKEKTESTVKTETTQPTATTTQAAATPKSYTEHEGKRGRIFPVFEIGFGFLDDQGTDGNAFAYNFTAGVNYFFTDKAYAGARIGYNGASLSSQTVDISTHLISIPLEAGYTFDISEGKFAVIPCAGFGFNIGLKSKSDMKGYGEQDNEIGGKLGVDFSVGIRLRLWEWNISGIYEIPLNDRQKGYFGEDAYFKLAIGWGF